MHFELFGFWETCGGLGTELVRGQGISGARLEVCNTVDADQRVDVPIAHRGRKRGGAIAARHDISWS